MLYLKGCFADNISTRYHLSFCGLFSHRKEELQNRLIFEELSSKNLKHPDFKYRQTLERMTLLTYLKLLKIYIRA